jgi:hypothetical protein
VTILLLAVLVAVVVWAVVRMTRQRPVAATPAVAAPCTDAALEQARMRYARGEIQGDEFQRMAQELSGAEPGGSAAGPPLRRAIARRARWEPPVGPTGRADPYLVPRERPDRSSEVVGGDRRRGRDPRRRRGPVRLLPRHRGFSAGSALARHRVPDGARERRRWERLDRWSLERHHRLGRRVPRQRGAVRSDGTRRWGEPAPSPDP